MTKYNVLLLLLALLALPATGCGGGAKNDAQTQGSLPSSAELRTQLREATAASVDDFPAVRGRTLDDVAGDLTGTGTTLALATPNLTTGTNRLGFGVIDGDNSFVYGKTAVYLADGPNATARGPFPAPADLLLTDPAFRSRQAATEKDPFSAVYEATVELPRAGKTAMLVVSKLNDGRLIGAGATIRIRTPAADPVAAVGSIAPKVATDTRASAGGIMKSIDTRLPTDDMHEESLTAVAGKKPVALLFATPQLCQSRVCGPVVDIAAQLKATYGDRMTFIHQEVYKDNDPNKGLRPSLRRFGLPSEPWLFILDRTGKITARLEGSFGFNAMRSAIETGLR